jgi:hypothetical protein
MWRPFVYAAALLSLSVHAAHAQESTEDRLRKQLRQVAIELRQLQDKQAVLEGRAAAAEMERDALRKEVEALRARASSSAGDSRARAALQASVAQYKGAAEQAAQAARAKEAERAQFQAALQGKSAAYDACVAKNVELYRVGTDILKAYSDYTLGDRIAASEPVLGLYRVKLENLMQGYEDRLYSGQFDPRAVPPPAASQPAPPGQPAAQPAGQAQPQQASQPATPPAAQPQAGQ